MPRPPLPPDHVPYHAYGWSSKVDLRPLGGKLTTTKYGSDLGNVICRAWEAMRQNCPAHIVADHPDGKIAARFAFTPSPPDGAGNGVATASATRSTGRVQPATGRTRWTRDPNHDATIDASPNELQGLIDWITEFPEAMDFRMPLPYGHFLAVHTATSLSHDQRMQRHRRVWSPPELVVTHPRNEHGRDFVVGDIHGCFKALRKIMKHVDFDPDHDRLFSVGDLIDRGPDPHAAPDWIGESWFHAVRGNHEQMLIDGERWDDEHRYDSDMRKYLALLPYAREVELAEGCLLIVHAGLPDDTPWAEIKAQLPTHDTDLLHALQWTYYTSFRGENDPLPQVPDVYRVVTGHKVVSAPKWVGANILDIDTGGAVRGRLTMVQVSPGPWTVWTRYGRSTFDRDEKRGIHEETLPSPASQ